MSDANEPTIGVLGLLLGFLGLAVTIIGGFVKFLYGRTAETDERMTALAGEMRQAMQMQASEHRNALADHASEQRKAISDMVDQITAVAGELRQAGQIQASDHRLAQTNLWTEIRRIGDANHTTQVAISDTMIKNHIAVLETMGKLASREEMQRDQDAMESRLMSILRKEVSNR